MVAVSLSVSLVLTAAFFIHYLSNTSELHEATLRANALAIAAALIKGRDPAKLALYRNYPQSYGFRVFDRRLLAKRRILASANTRWLPLVQHPAPAQNDLDGDRDLQAVGTDLLEGFQQFQPAHLGKGPVVSLLVHRVVLSGRKYWVQIYMIGDPAWAGLAIILDKLLSHVLFPVLFIVPALTLAIFLTTRRALRPLRRLSGDASLIGSAVARGQPLSPISEQGLVQEFADVAAAINAMLAKLERSLQLQKQFASDAAHELRTPLAVLLLETSQLPRGSARERIKADLEELGRLVNELLRFAQAEDAMAYELNDVDVVAVVRKVCEDAVIKAIARNQAIELDHIASQMIMPGNSALIEIAVRNLVDNALKYSHPNTTVTVRVDMGPKVIVEDCGPGIPLAQRDTVFERFWRANRQEENGAGVGLALVRRIAQLHDASVYLDDTVSSGTRMILDFGRPTPHVIMRKKFTARELRETS
ncbi:MAG: HAMP domain-containing histidine kinase [Alphaproteobacteria bacterium]|nr:HAMP domain-containing histidine kinase [Alphaproteobacteria bacterium]MDE2494600.1 HAMP domain-containing histidine kinase [Alphaproteobacteria bacterium]